MKNLFDIQGQVVVVTGGTGVLGREIGEYLALQGAKVVLMGRNEETGKQIADDICGKGGEVMFLKTDVMNPVVVEQNLQDVLSAYGKVDALLNAAGGNMPGADRDILRPQGGRVRTGVECKPYGNGHPHADIPPPDGGGRKGRDCQFQFHGGFPSHDPRVRLCGSQSGHFQLHGLLGQ